jgi:DNA-binding MarR family transcriptional regulator
MRAGTDPALVASEVRVVLGRLMRRLRAEHPFPLSQGSVLGRLDREGPRSVSDLAHAEGVRSQSMAQTVGELESDGCVRRRPDPGDRRRVLVELTEPGRVTLEAERRRRDGWLARAIAERLTPEEQAVLARAVELMRRVVES